MQLTGTVADWLAGVSPAVAFLPKKSSLPILESAKITATPEGVSLEVTNLETGYVGPLPISTDAPGSLLLPLKRLSDLLHSLPADIPCTIDTTATHLRLRTPTGRWVLPVLPVEDFPQRPALEAEALTLHVPGMKLAACLEQGGYAFASETTRPLLSTVSLTSAQDTLTVVSTDGIRLAHSAYSPDMTLPPFTVCLLGEAAVLIARWLRSRGETPVTLALTPTVLTWTSQGATVITRLAASTFPDWHGLVPRFSHPAAQIPHAAFVNVLQRGATQQTNRGHDLTQLTVLDDTLLVGTYTLEGRVLGQEHVDCAYTGAPTHLRCKSAFLLAALSHMPEGTTQVCLSIEEARKPLLLTPAQESTTFTLLIGVKESVAGTPEQETASLAAV